MTPTLSLCMIVKDEALLLARAIASVRDVVDECLVVDTGSTDDTADIARACGARVVEHHWDDNYARARNRYLREAIGDWVLVLDGDERIAARDAVRIRGLIEAADVSGYMMRVHNYSSSMDLLGGWHPNRGAYPDEERESACPGASQFDVLRLFRRDSSVRYDEGYSSHVNPLRSVRAIGDVRHSGIVVHHFQYLKGGDGFIAGKQVQRLTSELRQADAYPDDFLARLNAGRTLFSLGRDAEALAHLTAAVSLEGRRELAHLARASLLCETGRSADAVADLHAAIAIAPALADAWTVLGIALHDLGDLAAAADALRTALEHHPDHPLAHNSLGVVYLDLGDSSRAERHFVEALAILPGFPAAIDNLRHLRASSSTSAPPDAEEARAPHAAR